jgi:tryptophan synthase beta chain
MFTAFIEDRVVKIHGVEAAGKGLDTQEHAASLSLGRPGILHGSYSYILHDENGQIIPAHSISAGLDYPGVGPEHAYLKETGRVRYTAVTDEEAMEAVKKLCELEGIIPAIESAHALSEAIRLAANGSAAEKILVCLSGRGDKDMGTIREYFQGES